MIECFYVEELIIELTSQQSYPVPTSKRALIVGLSLILLSNVFIKSKTMFYIPESQNMCFIWILKMQLLVIRLTAALEKAITMKCQGLVFLLGY